MAQEKVLIIKTGYSEFLDNDNNARKVSLGDVLRTTPLLHHYKHDHVTWLTDQEAIPLLEGSKLIDRLVPLNFWTAIQLQTERFDTVINLEKNHEICELSKRIEAWRKLGFRPDPDGGKPKAYDRAFEVLAVSSTPELKRQNTKIVQELLYDTVGGEWQGEDYELGYKPESTEVYDVGFNTIVGPKWPVKVWPTQFWDDLEKQLAQDRFTVSRQEQQNEEVLKDLHKYINWINSCRTIVTSDSLGLHIALALKKRVLALFGPTPHKEVHFYGRGRALLPDEIPECLPCFASHCERGRNCMDDISVDRVYDALKEVMQNGAKKQV